MDRRFLSVLLCLALVAMSGVAQAGFESFVIRNGASGSPSILTNNDYVPGATEFVISESGMKAGLGTDDLNGRTIGEIERLAITRHDDTTRFTPGSGPAVAPYFNIWVTDGLGNYATLSNMPSRALFQPLFTTNLDGSKTYDLSFDDLTDKCVQVYECPNGGYGSTTTWVHNLVGKNQELTFDDVASLQIAPPPVDYIQNSANNVGSGAADDIDNYKAYGFNWVFGDTLSNYVSGQETEEGYVVSSPAVAPIPLPPSMAMTLMGLVGVGGFGWLRRRRS